MNTATAFQTARITPQDGSVPWQSLAEPLTENDRQEVIDFLAPRPQQTVILSGLIADNGIVSPANRGTFYGCRDRSGVLAGVGLVGKNTLLEARTDEAIAAFAKCAKRCPDVQMVFAEDGQIAKFWDHYAIADTLPRLSSTELLISVSKIKSEIDDINELRLATNDDLDQIVTAHAEMVLSASGIDPLETDPVGFRSRCSQRIEKGRVWVWTKNGKLMFKTDILCVTPEAVYIEGLWVHPTERRKGYSGRCLTNLCSRLLDGENTICGFVDARNAVSRSVLLAAGFEITHKYTKIYI